MQLGIQLVMIRLVKVINIFCLKTEKNEFACREIILFNYKLLFQLGMRKLQDCPVAYQLYDEVGRI